MDIDTYKILSILQILKIFWFSMIQSEKEIEGLVDYLDP